MGRKRQQGVKRTASGRRSRAKSAYGENEAAFATRVRLFGLSEADARDQKAETVVGRLCLTKAISEDQYQASQTYLKLHEAYRRALKSPEALRSSNGGGNHGESDGYAEWCRAAIERYDSAMAAVRAEQSLLEYRGHNLFAGLDYLVVRGESFAHLVGDCRLALNALDHHFGGKRKPRQSAPLVAAA